MKPTFGSCGITCCVALFSS